MNKFIAALLVCLAIGIHAATIDEARSQLDKLAEIATSQSEAALRVLNKVADTIRELSQNVLASGSRLIDAEERRLHNDLQDIVKSANQMQVNVSSCTNTKESVLTELAALSALAVTSCVDRFTSQATTATSQGLGQLNTVLTDVFSLRNKLESCKANDAACINSIVTQIKFQELDIPRRIQEHLDTASNKAEVNRLYLNECGIREAEYLVQHGGELLQNVETCVNRLIDGKNSTMTF